jgi:DsbC/DsbD-like thiol-disulfide interchange protein/cytochrome c biogenesis protein CcdA
MLKHSVLICGLIGVLLSGQLLAASGEPDTHPDTQVELVTDSSHFMADGKVDLALHFTPKSGWHLYWKNYGDTGAETSVEFSGWPTGTKIGLWDYPTPKRLPFGEQMNFGYEKPITLLSAVKLPKGFRLSPMAVTAHINWLACTQEVCVPEEKAIKLKLSDRAELPDAKVRKLFAGGHADLPAKPVWPSRYHIAKGLFQIRVQTDIMLDKIASAEFFPNASLLIQHSAPQRVLKKGQLLWLETRADSNHVTTNVGGVLVLVGKEGQRQGYDLTFTASDTPLVQPSDAIAVGAVRPGATDVTKPAVISFGLAFILAVLGGLCLNLMPCVFPILALKAFSLARAVESDAQARRDGLGYTAGVLATFALIGGTLLILRSGGASLGWGFLLQDPRIVTVLALLMVLIALNLAGFFEIGSRLGSIGGDLAQKSGVAGAFWTGALAVLVATPCTAPFMAVALGAALVLPPVAGFFVFLGLGLGMALPFLALGFLPVVRRLLPKPGAWMESFRHFLAFPMLATALWLFWVVGQLTDSTAMAMVIGAGLLLALAIWLWGRGKRRIKMSALLVGVAALALPILALQTPDVMVSEPFSEARLADLVAARKPVFVYFTADWCISCKVNEKVALNRKEVQSAFASRGVTVLRGDWTKRDPALGKVLEHYGRAGVPLYLYFKKGALLDKPEVLSQVLTPGLLVKTVR